LTVWLLDEQGADVNATTSLGPNPLYEARSLDNLTALMDRGADPTLVNIYGTTPLMQLARNGVVENVARLLQDLRVRATVNVQDNEGMTALHCASKNEDKTEAIVHLLLQAGGNPALTDGYGDTPLA